MSSWIDWADYINALPHTNATVLPPSADATPPTKIKPPQLARIQEARKMLFIPNNDNMEATKTLDLLLKCARRRT